MRTSCTLKKLNKVIVQIENGIICKEKEPHESYWRTFERTNQPLGFSNKDTRFTYFVT